jgi:hypothetical protein
VGSHNLSVGGRQAADSRTRDIESIDSELQRVAAFRRASQDRRGSLSLIDVVDALLDERLRARRVGYNPWVVLLEMPR